MSGSRDLDRLPIMIEEQSGLSMTDIRVKAEMMMEDMQRHGSTLDMLVIDHLGLIRASGRYSGNRVQEISEMTAGCKELAREYGLAVVLLSQLNRAVESRDNKVPQLSDLRDSGSIEQDADTIIFLYREAYYLQRDKSGDFEKQQDRAERLADCENKLEFHIAKQRNGPLKSIDLFIDVACSAVRNGAHQ
jgi:replicative DNA helicase